jgi:hypothetical protein
MKEIRFNDLSLLNQILITLGVAGFGLSITLTFALARFGG